MSRSKTLFRRHVENEAEQLAHAVRVGLYLFAGILLFAFVLSPTIFRVAFLDLQSVTVADHVVGDDPEVTVYRNIHSSGPFGYSVTIRRADTGAFVCSKGPDAPFPYNPLADELVQPLVLPLSAWLDDKEALEDCERRGFGAGTFYIKTCHEYALIPLLRRCADSAVFQRGAGDA